jgi:hypothetical protein
MRAGGSAAKRGSLATLTISVRSTSVSACAGVERSRVRQLNAQVIDCYELEFKNVYYNRESCCG